MTIEHKYGSTEVAAEPQRVVLVGLTEQDAMLALGKVPVATSNFLDTPGGIHPWAEAALGSAPRPEVLDQTDGIPFEKIAPTIAQPRVPTELDQFVDGDGFGGVVRLGGARHAARPAGERPRLQSAGRGDAGPGGVPERERHPRRVVLVHHAAEHPVPARRAGPQLAAAVDGDPATAA